MNLYPEQVPNEKSSPWSVSEFTARVKYTLESTIAYCWLKGEISNLRIQSSGHAYFSLKDMGSQVSCVLFRGSRSRVKVELREGMEVVLGGELSVYEPRGNYQIIAREVIESGLGKLQVEFERLKQKLQNEGLFEQERKKKLPLLIQRVAVITSPTGAAIQDFCEILKRRDYRGEVSIFPSLMQGEQAASQVIEQIDFIEKNELAELIVITRGGGSIEDLWAFNNESLTRRVAQSTLPIISAIGHEIDFTLIDFVADKRAETPSGAAELISSAYLEQVTIIDDCQNSIEEIVRSFLQRAKDLLEHREKTLKLLSPQRLIEALSQRVDDLESSLTRTLQKNISDKKQIVEQLSDALSRHSPTNRIKLEDQHLTYLEKELSKSIEHYFRQSSQGIDSLEKRLHNCSHHKVLQRGYAIVEDKDEQPLTNFSEIKKRETIHLRLADGVIDLKQSNPPKDA